MSPASAGRRPPRPPARVAAVAVLVAVLGLAGCSGDSDDSGGGTSPSSVAGSQASDTKAQARDVITVAQVSGGQLGEARRQQMKKDISAVVDRWIDGAYLGTFPRTDYTGAFADFTPQASALAMKQLDLMSNQSISDQISKATATNRRVRLTVFAPHGLARGVTARIVLDFTTTGDLKEDQRVLGQLYLTKPKGKSWQVFGFRVGQAVTR